MSGKIDDFYTGDMPGLERCSFSGVPAPARPPAVAGTFYPAQPEQCRDEAQRLFRLGEVAAQTSAADIGAAPVGAIVPHAGWICSGAIAAEAIAAIAARRPLIDLVVVFGAIHTPIQTRLAILDSYQRWAIPGPEMNVNREARDRIAASGGLFAVDDRFHQREHAVEVELPIIRHAWPGAAILPVETPPVEQAVEFGVSIARAIAAMGLAAIFLASSDLTHYGPSYGFAPAGVGPVGLDWARNNDRELLSVVTDMTPERIVPHVASTLSACGAGAIAAMMGAAQASGAQRAKVLRHASSFETLAEIAPQSPTNAVGYAAVVLW